MSKENLYAPPEANLVVPADESLGSELASRWMRLWGVCIDGLVSIAILGPVMYFTGYWDRAMANDISIIEASLYGLLGLALYFVVNGYLLSKKGQTVGKLLVRTKIVSVETDEIIPLWKVIVLRYLPMGVAAQIPVVGSFFALANGLFIYRKDKRCIHDLIAGTKVIKAR